MQLNRSDNILGSFHFVHPSFQGIRDRTDLQYHNLTYNPQIGGGGELLSKMKASSE